MCKFVEVCSYLQGRYPSAFATCYHNYKTSCTGLLACTLKTLSIGYWFYASAKGIAIYKPSTSRIVVLLYINSGAMHVPDVSPVIDARYVQLRLGPIGRCPRRIIVSTMPTIAEVLSTQSMYTASSWKRHTRHVPLSYAPLLQLLCN